LKKLIPAAFARDGGSHPGADLGLGGITRGLEIWKPMIAAINGHCLAGGLEQALACDLRIASENATFGLTEVRWAIMPGAGGTQRLPRAVPLARAMEMILMAQTVDAQEALRMGLVNTVVPLAELMPTARAWAETICERGPLAVRAAKEAVLRGLTMPIADGLRVEALLSATLRGTEDAVEGPKAFAEKRKPNFKAR
jgi:E-phenylitaconyl-CoA hydratase